MYQVKKELPDDRARRRLRNRARPRTVVMVSYIARNGAKRELRLHATKGFRDVLA